MVQIKHLLCVKKIYTVELINYPVQVHQSQHSVQEQPTEPSSPFHLQLIQQSSAVPNFPMLLLTIQFFRYIMFQEMDPVFLEKKTRSIFLS